MDRAEAAALCTTLQTTDDPVERLRCQYFLGIVDAFEFEDELEAIFKADAEEESRLEALRIELFGVA